MLQRFIHPMQELSVPLVTIYSLPPADLASVPPMITAVRDAGTRALSCSPANIWVMFAPIAPGHYVQGLGEPAPHPQQDSHPPVVIVRAQVGRSATEREALVSAVADTVGRHLSVPPTNV